MDIKSKVIKAERDMFNIYYLKSLGEKFNPLLVMNIESPKRSTQHTEFYLVGGRLYYIIRDENINPSSKPMTLADFIARANPVTIGTVFHFRPCFMWGFRSEKVDYLGELSEYSEDFKYTAVVLYGSIHSTITVYGYSNISYRFAFNKAKEFIEPLISVCDDINYEINKGYDPLNDPIPTMLLLKIKKVIM